MRESGRVCLDIEDLLYAVPSDESGVHQSKLDISWIQFERCSMDAQLLSFSVR